MAVKGSFHSMQVESHAGAPPSLRSPNRSHKRISAKCMNSIAPASIPTCLLQNRKRYKLSFYVLLVLFGNDGNCNYRWVFKTRNVPTGSLKYAPFVREDVKPYPVCLAGEPDAEALIFLPSQYFRLSHQIPKTVRVRYL